MKLPLAFAAFAVAGAVQGTSFAAPTANDSLVNNALSMPAGRATLSTAQAGLMNPVGRTQFAKMETNLQTPACINSVEAYAQTVTSIMNVVQTKGTLPRAGEAERLLMVQKVIPGQRAQVEENCHASPEQIATHRVKQLTRSKDAQSGLK